MSNDLAASIEATKRQNRLKWYEDEITKRGKSLAAIFIELRDDPLKPWKLAHDTFDAYCAERWGLTQRRMQQLAAGESVKALLATEAPDMAETVSAMPEGQIRALASVAPEKRIEVLKTAVASTRKLTAKTIKQAKAIVIDIHPATGEPTEPKLPERCPHCGQTMP